MVTTGPALRLRIIVQGEQRDLAFDETVRLYRELVRDADEQAQVLLKREVRVGAFLLQVKSGLSRSAWSSWLGVTGIHPKVAGRRVRLAAVYADVHGELDQDKLMAAVKAWNEEYADDRNMAIDAKTISLRQAELAGGIRKPTQTAPESRRTHGSASGSGGSGTRASERSEEELLDLVGDGLDEESLLAEARPEWFSDDDDKAGDLDPRGQASRPSDPRGPLSLSDAQSVRPVSVNPAAPRPTVAPMTGPQLVLLDVYAAVDRLKARAEKVVSGDATKADRAAAILERAERELAELGEAA